MEVVRPILGDEGCSRTVWIVAVELVAGLVVSAEKDVVWLMLRVEVREG